MSLLLKNAQAALEGGHMGIERIHIGMLRTDGGTQMRAALDDATVQEYADAIIAGATFPAIIAYYDGTDYWLADGFHRIAAHKLVHQRSKTAWGEVEVDVRSGTRRDAILHAAGANADHGLRRTNADKRRAVESLLRDPEWSQWSDREIARRCHVDHKTVGSIRAEMVGTGEIPQLDERRTADGRTMNTANIGVKPPLQITYGALCLLIEREIAPTCDLWPADMDWLVNYVSDAVLRKNMTASEQDIMTAIIDTREDLRSRQEREDRLSRAIAAAEAADAERSKSEAIASSPAVQPSDMPSDVKLLEVFELETQVRMVVKQFYAELHEQRTMPADLRASARTNAGGFWTAITRQLLGKTYHKRDLIQAINNVASQMEAKTSDVERSNSTGAVGDNAVEPPEMPEDLAAAGWKLREVHGINGRSSWIRWWCYNDDGHRATDSYDVPEDAIRSAYDMQRDLAARGHDPYDHDNPDAIRNDLAAAETAPRPALADMDLEAIESDLHALLQSILLPKNGSTRLSITLDISSGLAIWDVDAWKPQPGSMMSGSSGFADLRLAVQNVLQRS